MVAVSGTVPQAAGGTVDGGIEKALDVLRLLYGDDGYAFGHNPENGWWAIRDGRIERRLTAGSAEALGRLIDTGDEP